MLNDNWDKIDEAVGQVREELANVNVDIPDASLREKGIVQLSNATNGTREDVAATEKAVKAAYDEALAGKQLGVEQKANVVAALNSIGVAASASETWSQLVAKMAGVIRATGNATPGDVLAGKIASNQYGEIIGEIPVRGEGGTVVIGTRDIVKLSGYYSSDIVIKGDQNKIPNNIKYGIKIDGVEGTFTSDATASSTDLITGKSAYVKGHKIVGTLVPKSKQASGTVTTEYSKVFNFNISNLNFTPSKLIFTVNNSSFGYQIGGSVFIDGNNPHVNLCGGGIQPGEVMEYFVVSNVSMFNGGFTATASATGRAMDYRFTITWTAIE
ncbi:hypothetical protein CHH67_08415 [Paenibacillus campinasensis]|uniref:Tail fiber protein n=2 Tax=Paenibacillus campinasensis TaxID=66347 RepID=A0A268EY48_9BACL|nr:hypothetical protein CHH67_08415 [Paenibacillus campinasensis]